VGYGHNRISRRAAAVDRLFSRVRVGNKEVGAILHKHVFGPGRTLRWNELMKHATGEPLKAKAFAADFKAT
jgi:hypothetical protein